MYHIERGEDGYLTVYMQDASMHPEAQCSSHGESDAGCAQQQTKMASLPLAWCADPHLQEDAGQDDHGHACAKVLVRDADQGRGDACMAGDRPRVTPPLAMDMQPRCHTRPT